MVSPDPAKVVDGENDETSSTNQYQRNLQVAVPLPQLTRTWTTLSCGSLLPKDVDSVSTASSTHFTIVNGMTGGERSSNYQLSVLLVTMTTVLLIIVLAAVIFIQKRARDLRNT